MLLVRKRTLRERLDVARKDRFDELLDVMEHFERPAFWGDMGNRLEQSPYPTDVRLAVSGADPENENPYIITGGRCTVEHQLHRLWLYEKRNKRTQKELAGLRMVRLAPYNQYADQIANSAVAAFEEEVQVMQGERIIPTYKKLRQKFDSLELHAMVKIFKVAATHGSNTHEAYVGDDHLAWKDFLDRGEIHGQTLGNEHPHT